MGGRPRRDRRGVPHRRTRPGTARPARRLRDRPALPRQGPRDRRQRRRVVITGPGIYEGIPEDTYHADTDLSPELGRSLSASGAKVLLKSPARYEYERRHPRPSSDAMDLGSVAHELILRTGTRILVVDAYDWRGRADQATRKAERAKGTIVVNRPELRAAAKMAAAVRRHPLASRIFTDGRPEVSLYWIDEATGVTCRGRVDYLRARHIVDLKTARDASPRGFAKAAADYGYRESMAHYQRGVAALTGEWLPVVLVVVESEPPHLVAVYAFSNEDRSEERRVGKECRSRWSP